MTIRARDTGVVMETGRTRRVAFYVLAGFLTFGLITQFWRVNLTPILVWFPGDFVDDFYRPSIEMFSVHRIHVLALALSHLLVTFGVAIQLWKSEKWVAPMWQASGSIAISVVLLLLIRPPVESVPPFVYVVLVLVVVLGFLHPGSALLQAPRPDDRTMTLLWLFLALPALVYSVQQLGLQVSGVPADSHWTESHYQMAAEYGIHLILVAFLGASALKGWRVTAWWAASTAVFMGAAFIVHSDASSSGGAAWGFALIAWAAAYGFATERRARHGRASALSNG